MQVFPVRRELKTTVSQRKRPRLGDPTRRVIMTSVVATYRRTWCVQTLWRLTLMLALQVFVGTRLREWSVKEFSPAKEGSENPTNEQLMSVEKGVQLVDAIIGSSRHRRSLTGIAPLMQALLAADERNAVRSWCVVVRHSPTSKTAATRSDAYLSRARFISQNHVAPNS